MSSVGSTVHSKSHYIGSIDGLRAVAVLLVLLFHLDITYAHSGFIGVDVFFVISGFLITRNIMKSVTDKEFSFLDFYFRRAARLMPSVLAVVFLTLVGGYFFLTAQDYNRLGFSSFLASISLSNIFFWSEAGYFAQASTTKPLLHTWSLAVEEQFYLIWPIFLVFCLASGRKLLMFSMLALGSLSLLAALYFHRTHPDMVFFLAPFRVFQFAIGGLINFLPMKAMRNRLSGLGILSVIALFVLAAILPSDLSGFSHVVIVMLLPAFLTGLFIFSARSKTQERVFSTPLLKYLGERSYAIYLVHWPIIVYWNMATDYVLNPIEQVGLFIASIGLGEILHQCVEKPFRLSRSASAKRVLRTKMFLLCLGASVAFLAINVTYFNGFAKKENTASAYNNEQIAEAGDVGNSNDDAGRCFMRQQDDPDLYGLEKCATAPEGKRPRVLVFGDSYAGDVYIALKVGYSNPYFGHFVVPGCPLETPKQAEANRNQCHAHYNHAYKTVISKDRFDYVALVSNWTTVDEADIVETKAYLESLGLKTVVIGLRPRFRERVPDIIENSTDNEAAKTRANAILVQDYMQSAEAMRSKAESYGQYMDLMSLLCSDDGICDIETPRGDMLYSDESHFTLRGSSYAGRELKKAYPTIFE